MASVIRLYYRNKIPGHTVVLLSALPSFGVYGRKICKFDSNLLELAAF